MTIFPVVSSNSKMDVIFLVDLQQHCYFVKRTKNHMLPVYFKPNLLGRYHVTQIRNVDGDLHVSSKPHTAGLPKTRGQGTQSCVKSQIWE